MGTAVDIESRGQLVEDMEKFENEKTALRNDEQEMCSNIKFYQEEYAFAATNRLSCQKAMNEIESLIKGCKNAKLKKLLNGIISECHSQGEERLRKVNEEFSHVLNNSP